MIDIGDEMIIQPHCFIDYQEIKDQKVMEKL
jgi:hypothetical protein